MLLLFILSLLFFTILVLYFNKNHFRLLSLYSSGLIFVLSSFLLACFDSNNYHFQNYFVLNLGSIVYNLTFSFGFDGISILFFWLTSLLIFLCILFVWNDSHLKEYLINLLIIELLLFLVF